MNVLLVAVYGFYRVVTDGRVYQVLDTRDGTLHYEGNRDMAEQVGRMLETTEAREETER